MLCRMFRAVVPIVMESSLAAVVTATVVVIVVAVTAGIAIAVAVSMIQCGGLLVVVQFDKVHLPSQCGAAVFDGDLDQFMEGFLRWKRAEATADA